MGTFILTPKQTMVPSFPNGKYYTKAQSDAKYALIGSGFVTSVATDATLTGGPITTTGTLGINLSNANIWNALQTFPDNDFKLTNAADNTKTGVFSLANVTTGTAVTYSMPSGALTAIALATTSNVTQTFTGATTVSGVFTASSTTVNIGTSGSSSSINLGSGATTNGNTKTVNIGTTGMSGSTTTINIGSAVAGATTNATLNGSLTLGTAGNKINITTGSNASVGTATLSGGTVTVSTTAVTASSKIFLTDATTGTLTNVGSPTVGTIVAGTSFVINSTNVLDASNVNWLIIN